MGDITTPTADSTGAIAGTTVITDSVIAKIAGIAAREVSGVHALGGGATRALGAIRDVISGTDPSQGVSITITESQVSVDVSLVADYPFPLHTVAADVRAAVITSIETLVGLDVTEVNVTINDIHLASDDNDDKAGA